MSGAAATPAPKGRQAPHVPVTRGSSGAPATPPIARPWFTPDEAAAALGLPSRAALARLVRVEGLPCARVSGANGMVVFLVEDLAAWLRGRRVANESAEAISDRISGTLPGSA